MKDFYVRDCQQHENKTITSSFVVASKQVKTKKNGEFYLAVTLADRTGHLQANMWDNVSDSIDAVEQDDFVKVKGMVQKYNGRWQLTIHKIRKLGDSEIDYSDYLPKTSKDIEQLWRTLGDFVETFENPWLKQLVKDFMADEAIATAYKNAPAAKTLHHAFVGGLLDHVVSLFTACDLVVRNYPAGESRSAAHRRVPARYRQDSRAGVPAFHHVHHQGPIVGPHDHRAGDVARQAFGHPWLP